MRSEAAILELVESGLYRDAADAIDAAPFQSNLLKVTRAKLEIDVGSLLHARSRAEALLTQRLSHSERSTCWEIVGCAELNARQVERGLKAMHQAFSASSLAQDPRLQTRLIAINCDALLHWVGIEPAEAEVPRLRRAAISTGDPHSLITFHSIVAELKAKKALISSAKRSIDTAKELLRRWPNVWQQGRLAVVKSVIHCMESDYELALTTTHEVMDCATRCGSRRLRIPAIANLAHIKLLQGQFQQAQESIVRFQSAAQKGSDVFIAVLDTEMQIALASGDLELSSDLAQRIQVLILEAGPSYHGLWHVLTRVKWLYRIGDVQAGVALALDAIPRIQRTADRNLLDRIRLLAAEGLGRTGRATEGATFLASANSENRDYPLEIMAEAMRVAGRLTASGDSAAAKEHFERAAHIFQVAGNVAARDEVSRDVTETLGEALSLTANTRAVNSADVSPAHVNGHGSSRSAAAAFSERIAAAIEFASLPPLLASEFFSLVVDTKSALHAAVVAEQEEGPSELLAEFLHPGSSRSLDDPDVVRIALGTFRDRNYKVLALPQPSASARATILAIQRLAHSALAVSRARLLDRERADLWPEATPEQQLGLICSSERMLDLVKTIRRVAATNVTVLLTGETGVGKELFARALHQASARSDKIFLPFNCATVPREMFDSQLFGHRRGSFTGAIDDSAGVIRSAAGGTLFLDEIGEMSLDTQPKLLRFLESGEIRPLGDAKPQLVDVRIVAATNANLDQLIGEGRFREDLYYRLNVIRINIPPLRDRREEIPALVEHFLERYGHEFQKPQLRVSDEALEYLVLYRWPGNVRQLANEVRRMVALAEPGAVLMPAHLSEDIAASRKTIPTGRPALQSTEVMTRLDQPLTAAVEHIERAAIQRAVSVAEGNLLEAARMLGLSRKGLYLKRQRLGLE